MCKQWLHLSDRAEIGKFTKIVKKVTYSKSGYFSYGKEVTYRCIGDLNCFTI